MLNNKRKIPANKCRREGIAEKVSRHTVNAADRSGKTYRRIKLRRLRTVAASNSSDAKGGRIADCPERTFSEATEEFLLHKKQRVKESSLARYAEILEKYLIPRLGPMPLSSVDLETVNLLAERLLSCGRSDGRGLAVKTVKDIVAVLKLVLKFAEDRAYIQAAPQSFDLPKLRHTQARILSDSQRMRLEAFSRSTSEPMKFGVYLCLYTGMRIGELCALQWHNIDC